METPSCSVVRPPPRARQRLHAGVAARDISRRTDDRHTQRLEGVGAEQEPPWDYLMLSHLKLLTVIQESRTKQYAACAPQSNSAVVKTADAGTFHLPKNHPKSGGYRDIRGVEFTRVKGESSRTF